MRGITYLLKYAWKYQKKYIFYSIIQEILSAISPMITIIVPKYLIDELMGSQRFCYIAVCLIILIGSNFFCSIMCSMLQKECFLLKGKLFVDFQENISRSLSICDYEKLEDPVFLDIKEKAKKFLFSNGQGFGEVMDYAFHVFGNVLKFVGILSVIMTLNIVMILILVFLVLINTFAQGKLKEKYVKLDMEKVPVERRTNYLISVIEDFSYGKEMRIFNLSDWFSAKVRYYLEVSQRFYKKQMNSIVKGQYLAGVTNFIQEIFVYLYLILQVITNHIGIGDFTMYLSAINNFSSSMNQLMKSWIEIRQFEGYYDALKEYMEVPSTMNCGNKEVPDGPYKIEFKNVSFKYPGQNVWALKNINVVMDDYKKYSIVGENGAGKTTFIKLLCRLYDPTEGEILLNGINIKEYEYQQYMNLFSTVFQDYKLFSFSISDNIVLSKNYSDEKIKMAIHKSGLDELIKSLEKGTECCIHKNFEEDGIEPSGGEGQKFALARALYQNRHIIILDEPAAALDPKAEAEMYENFNNFVDGRLTLYISHRMSSSRFCDDILVFRDGKIVEEGSHIDLMKRKRMYYELYRIQAKFYVEDSNYDI